MPSEKRKFGDIGEEIAARYLSGKGFSIVERNYLKKWGEIDIVTKKGDTLHFVEVKTLRFRLGQTSVYRPEENVHPGKLKRMHRAIETYLMDRKLDETEWQIDVVTVRLDLDVKKAKVEFIENILS